MIVNLLKKLGTVFYFLLFSPEDQAPEIASKLPGFPRLQTNEDGQELCVGCGLCAIYCPLDIIEVRAAKNPEDKPVSTGEAYAQYFALREDRCINCGYCEEACPRGAIKLVTEVNNATEIFENLILEKESLVK
ncbi:MAG: 4Fe-4S dicluster domain-containing protein [bacterium]